MFNLPNEIQLKIYEYDPTYKHIFRNVLNDMMPHASVNRMNNVWKFWNSNDTNQMRRSPMITLLINELVPDADLMVSNLSRCNCCYKHCIRRPIHLYDRTWIEFGLANPVEFYSHENNCKCICRHSSRWLCRTCNQYFQ